MGSMIPGEPLIYEQVGNIVYARYSCKPEIPRWIIGSSTPSTPEWQDMLKMCESNLMFKKEFDKLMNLYYLLKEEK